MSKTKLAEKAALAVPVLGLLTPLQGLGSEVVQPVQAPEPDKVGSAEQRSDSASLADIEASPPIKEALKDSVALGVGKNGQLFRQTKEKFYQDVQANLQKGSAPAVVKKGTLRPEFDRANIANPEPPDEETLQALRNIYQKKAVRMAVEDAYPIIIQWYGENGQTLKEKYFDDIQDKVVKVSSSLPAGTGTQDSTNITGTDFGYDNCNLNPTKTGVNYAAPGQGCICHGACHGQCHGSGCALEGWRNSPNTQGHNLERNQEAGDNNRYKFHSRKKESPSFGAFPFLLDTGFTSV